jgi:Protein of unknown function (DUF3667)
MAGTYSCSLCKPIKTVNCEMTNCKNCGHQFDFDYCNKCGQKASTKRIEMKWLLHELPHAVWHLEKGFLFNVVQLFKRPGYAIADYLTGKRKNFYHPVSYLLILLAIMYVVMHYLGAHWYDPVQDAGMSREDADFWIEYDKSQQLWTQNYFRYLLIYFPVSSLLFMAWLRILKQKYNYAESFIITVFSVAQIIIPQIIFFFLASVFDNTAFTRFQDIIINNLIGITMFFFQLYQLGNKSLKKIKRILLSFTGAVLFLAWIYISLILQSWIFKS